jgi:hypothetical protein
MDASQLCYPEILHSGPKQEFSSFTSRGFAKCSETLPNIILGRMYWNGCFTTLVLRNIAFGPEKRVLHLLCVEGKRNAPKHSQTLFWVQWTRMDASQLWYPKIVHSGSNRSFASCSCRRLVKSSETLTNIILGPMD